MPSMDPREERSPGSPVMPSFASLRGPASRSPVDLLVPAEPPAAPPQRTPEPPRPPERADLLHLAAHLAGVVLAVPGRWARRLLGS